MGPVRLQPVAGRAQTCCQRWRPSPARTPVSRAEWCWAARSVPTVCAPALPPALPGLLPCAEAACPVPACPVPLSGAWPSAHLSGQRSAAAHMDRAAQLLAEPWGWVRRLFRGRSQVSRVPAEICQAAPPSSCPVTSTQWTQCVPAASSARITVAWAGTLSFLISPLLPPALPPSPEGLFSSRLSSKGARDMAGKQPGTKQTFLIRITWIRPNFPFTCSATCELHCFSWWLSC